MAFTVSLNSVTEHHNFELPPPGEYNVKIVSAEERISNTSGNNMIELVCEIQHPNYKARLWEYIVDNQYASQRIYDILTSCGVAVKDGMTVTSNNFVGRSGKVKVKHEVKDGNTRLRINYWCKPEKKSEAAPTADKNDGIPF